MKKTRSQSIRRQAVSVWRTVRRAARALRAIHDEQVLVWEDGHRLTGSHLHLPDDTSEEGGVQLGP